MEISKNPAHVLAKRLKDNRKSLTISRIPEKTKAEFIAIAEEDFCGDYGMALKWLVDDMISKDMRLLLERFEALELRLDSLENKPVEQTEESSGTKMLDGRVRRGSN